MFSTNGRKRSPSVKGVGLGASVLSHSYRLAAKFRPFPTWHIGCPGQCAENPGPKNTLWTHPKETCENAHFFPVVPQTFTLSLQALSGWGTLALWDVEVAQTQLPLTQKGKISLRGFVFLVLFGLFINTGKRVVTWTISRSSGLLKGNYKSFCCKVSSDACSLPPWDVSFFIS